MVTIITEFITATNECSRGESHIMAQESSEVLPRDA